MPQSARKTGRKKLTQHAFDWVNNSDLTQLDAIMLALFVFGIGCTLITGLFVMGHLQSLALRHPAASPGAYNGSTTAAEAARYAAVAGHYTPVAARYQPVLSQTPYVCQPNRFGRPRSSEHHDGMWHPFAGEQSGQAEASNGYTY